MKKLTTIISFAIAAILLITAFSGCSPKIIQGTFELTPSENLFYEAGSGEALLVKVFDSFEEYEEWLNSSQIIIRFEPVGKSFNVFKDQYTHGSGFFNYCYTVTPVKIKEIIGCEEKYDLEVGDVIYFTDWYVYVTEEVYNARNIVEIDGFIYDGWDYLEKYIGSYMHASAYDNPWRNFVFLKIGEEYIARIGQSYHTWNEDEEKSFIFEKNGVEFELFHSAFEGTFPITEEIDRSKFTGPYLTLYDGFIEKYGNKEVLK
ncbi:MAG: hypothetical protein IKA51_03805 [Clostridia bacterium]|nr:hypothetical protein [Clostridia bacterium]